MIERWKLVRVPYIPIPHCSNNGADQKSLLVYTIDTHTCTTILGILPSRERGEKEAAYSLLFIADAGCIMER